MEPFKLSTEFWNQVSPGDAASSFIIHKDPSPSTTKPPPPPELPKSAFMCFSDHKLQSLKESNNLPTEVEYITQS